MQKKICVKKNKVSIVAVMLSFFLLAIAVQNVSNYLSSQKVSTNTKAAGLNKSVKIIGGDENNISPAPIKRFTHVDSKSKFNGDIRACTDQKNGPATWHSDCNVCTEQGVESIVACAVYPIGSSPSTLHDMKGCKAFGYQWYAHCNTCEKPGMKVNDVCKKNPIGELVSKDPYANKYTDPDSCGANGGAWYWSKFNNNDSNSYYNECNVCATTGQNDSVVCVIPPKGSNPETLFSEDVCKAFKFQWYSRCNLCGKVGAGLNNICSSSQLSYIDPYYGDKYTDITSCNAGGGAWYGVGAYDVTGKGVNCEVCAKTGTPTMKVCTDTTVSVKPGNLTSQTACESYNYQWYARCGKCAIVGTKLNAVCNNPALFYVDPEFGNTYTNPDTCTAKSGAWYGGGASDANGVGVNCNVCAKAFTSMAKVCTDYSTGSIPSKITNQKGCEELDYQWYSYCPNEKATGVCDKKGLGPNGPCPQKKLPITYKWATTYGKYTTIESCNKHGSEGSAWYSCNLCGRSGDDAVTTCGN